MPEQQPVVKQDEDNILELDTSASVDESTRLVEKFQNWLVEQQLPDYAIVPVVSLTKLLIILIICGIVSWIAKKYILKLIHKIINKTKVEWDDLLIRAGFFKRFLRLVPILVAYNFLHWFPDAENWLRKLFQCLMVLIILTSIDAFLNSVIAFYRNRENSTKRPIRGYIQTGKIIINIFGAIFILARLMNTQPMAIFTGLGAMTAVLMLVFKDTILGLIASIQISSNNLVRNGDWIEMPSYGADGDVIDISLHTIKVQNWDKTISTIPTYAIISNTFKNWRGMSESGGRRIKRSLNIDMNTIKFCDDKLIERFKTFEVLNDYLKTKENELAEHNQTTQIKSARINGRQLTNVGTFRAYIVEYLKRHPKIHKNMTFLVRQLEPSEQGLPIEIYVFSNDQDWVNYEGIQGDIFDHLLASLPLFELRVYQNPTGSDFLALK